MQDTYRFWRPASWPENRTRPDTPPALAAKWFGLSATELEAFYHGELPLTPAMAETAGSIFGTGAAPWLDMMAAWDEAHATEKAAP